jgi:hypothetical protein
VVPPLVKVGWLDELSLGDVPRAEEASQSAETARHARNAASRLVNHWIQSFARSAAPVSSHRPIALVGTDYRIDFRPWIDADLLDQLIRRLEGFRGFDTESGMYGIGGTDWKDGPAWPDLAVSVNSSDRALDVTLYAETALTTKAIATLLGSLHSTADSVRLLDDDGMEVPCQSWRRGGAAD